MVDVRIREERSYDDGVFRIGRTHGFLPRRSPLATLSAPFGPVQQLLDAMPVWLNRETGEKGLLAEPGAIEPRVLALPNLVDAVAALIPDDAASLQDKPDAARLLQALFRAYSFLASAYLLEPAHHATSREGVYGKARNVLPPAIAQPLVTAAKALGVSPWLDYHHAYSLGNYVHRDSSLQREALWHWSNLAMACRFCGTDDEVGFIMLHVQINQHTPALLGAMQDILRDAAAAEASDNPVGPWQRLLRSLEHINRARREMWSASRPERYNDFRVFIMGITGNEQLFGPGVTYEGVEEFGGEPQQFRGQTGAQDDIIPACDLLLGIDDAYPTNELTAYLKDLRNYRPPSVQRWFDDVRADRDETKLDAYVLGEPSLAILAAACVEQVLLFRMGHWQFVQKYILAHTRHAVATGGTPITTWLPNQIDACFSRMRTFLDAAKVDGLSTLDRRWRQRMFERLEEREKILADQRELLANPAFDPREIYARNAGHEDALMGR
jgi:indoleamine 2,3-dioxygenase